MKVIQLTALREECGGCPTHYTGQSVDGDDLDLYLRHGSMKVTLNDEVIVRSNPRGLDGVCTLEDFQREMLKKGYRLVYHEANVTSYIKEIEQTIRTLYKDKVWITFLRDLPSESAGETYHKGERYMMTIHTAEQLENLGFVTIEKSVISE